ncbi:MAG TPA: PAS domain-containing protein [Caulobacteraceae bacterium]|nr:PAS domain-containing protein [Caulobacteraceae bacterium]
MPDREAIRQALAASEARLELATQASGMGVWDWDLLSGEMVYSERAKEISGFPPGEPVTFEMVRGVTHPEDLQFTIPQMERATDPKIRDRSPYEYRLVRPDGEVRWVLAHGQALFEQGRAVRYVGTIQDITEQRQTAQELLDANARLRLAMDAGRMAVWDVDIGTGELTASPELNRLLDFPDGVTPTLDELRDRYVPGEGQRVRQAGQAALERGERYFEVEFRYRWRNESVRWMQLRAEIMRAEDGLPRHVLGVILDITDRKEAEDRLKLLAREVDHRANNLLAVVQATVKLSEADSAAGLKEVIEGRIAALAHAHNLLASGRWVGADLRRLIEEELKPYLTAAGRVRLEGPAVSLRPEAAQTLAMALHELATNAVKYGALHAPAGSISVSWSRTADGDLRLRWKETGAEGVKEPDRRGFGVGMVERAIHQLRGSAAFEWRSGGLVCDIELSADRLA